MKNLLLSNPSRENLSKPKFTESRPVEIIDVENDMKMNNSIEHLKRSHYRSNSQCDSKGIGLNRIGKFISKIDIPNRQFR